MSIQGTELAGTKAVFTATDFSSLIIEGVAAQKLESGIPVAEQSMSRLFVGNHAVVRAPRCAG